MTQIPDYIERRIRQPIPTGLCIVPESTPVVAFGDVQTAKVATLGLNPSYLEFQHGSGLELIGCFRRLATRKSLAVGSLWDAPQIVISQVLSDCNSYFERNLTANGLINLNLSSMLVERRITMALLVTLT